MYGTVGFSCCVVCLFLCWLTDLLHIDNVCFDAMIVFLFDFGGVLIKIYLLANFSCEAL
jgi:hypothetical protein